MVRLIKNQKGQVLIEILVAFGLAMILVPALLTGFISSESGKAQGIERQNALASLKEEEEMLRSIREKAWNNIATNGTFYPKISGTGLVLSTNTADGNVNGYTRKIIIANAYRDANQKLALTGTLDPSAKLITLTVSWGNLPTDSVSTSYYLTRYLENLIWLQTTALDFQGGTLNGTQITNDSGGEVKLGAGGTADWCNPDPSKIVEFDLPKSGVANAVSAIEGRVFAGTGDNASGVSFDNVSISNTIPPVPTSLGTFDGYKTNGIFGETNYAYVATDNNTKEIEIINLTTNPYSESGYFNAPGNGNGSSIYVVGNVGYMTSANKFYTFDLANKSGSRTQKGVATLSATGVKIYIVGNYAYVAESSSSKQFEIIDITNPNSPSVVGSISLSAGNGVDVFVNSTGARAYLATSWVSGKSEMFIVDVTTKNGNHTIALGNYSTNNMDPTGITVVPGNRAIVVGNGGAQQYQVIDITRENNLVQCTSNARSGGITISTGVRGISSVLESDGDAYSYIITGDASKELKIIPGGPGGQYSINGTFESSTFVNSGNWDIAFNRYIATSIIPNQTSLSYQFAGAHSVNGSCNGITFNYVGPDGTSNTKYVTTSGAILFNQDNIGYENPATCFRYKAFFSSSDINASPVLQDMSVNYSP
jgi:hypothetical protein